VSLFKSFTPSGIDVTKLSLFTHCLRTCPTRSAHMACWESQGADRDRDLKTEISFFFFFFRLGPEGSSGNPRCPLTFLGRRASSTDEGRHPIPKNRSERGSSCSRGARGHARDRDPREDDIDFRVLKSLPLEGPQKKQNPVRRNQN
jgi:hypothetical protein